MVRKLENYIHFEEYETDSICMDMEEMGNVAHQINDNTVTILISVFVARFKSMCFTQY